MRDAPYLPQQLLLDQHRCGTSTKRTHWKDLLLPGISNTYIMDAFIKILRGPGDGDDDPDGGRGESGHGTHDGLTASDTDDILSENEDPLQLEITSI